MHTIFKQKLKVDDIQTVQLPSNFNILHLGVQEGMPTFWYECSTDMPLVQLNIYCFGTGYKMDNLPALIYIGTVQLDGFVLHYYRAVDYKEIKEK